MATPTFVVNGTITAYGVKAEWQRVPKRQNSDGTVTWQNYAVHTWDVPQMEMDTYLSLLAQSGKRLTSLATTNIDDVNNGATYTAVELAVVNAQQIGRRAVGIRCEFRVDIT